MKQVTHPTRKETRPVGRAPASSGGATLASLAAARRGRSEFGRLLHGPPVQPKVAVGPAGDRFEREADAVAARVMAGQQAPPISRIPSPGLDPAQRQTEDEEETVQARLLQRQTEVEEEEDAVQTQLLQRQTEVEEEEEPVQTQLLQRQTEVEEEEEPIQTQLIQRQTEIEEEEEPVQTQLIQRQTEIEDEEEPVQTQLIQRQAEIDEEEEPVQAKTGGDTASSTMARAAQRAIDGRGAGRPLAPETRSTLESRMGADLSRVRVHDDSAAHSAAGALGARAFTHGSDIWLGRGESQADTRLMAHEATHVVQQGGDVRRLLVQRQDPPPGGGGSVVTADDDVEQEAQRDLRKFRLPRIKARHKPLYDSWASGGRLKRVAAYERGNPDQKNGVWLPNVNIAQDKLESLDLDPSFEGSKSISVHGRPVTGTYQEIVDLIKVPNWDRRGRVLSHPFEVDHIVELQVGSWTGSGPANTLENMELLDKSANASAGGGTRSSIRANVRNYLAATGRPSGRAAVNEYLANNDIEFNAVELREGGRAETNSQWWTRAEIERGDQIEGAHPIGNIGEAGSATSFALMSPGGILTLAEYPHEEANLSIAIEDEVQQTRVAGLRLSSITLDNNYTSAQGNNRVGTASATWDLPEELQAPETSFEIQIHRSTQYSGYLGELPSLSDAEFDPLSALSFERVSLEGGEISASGLLTPSVPLLGTVPIEVALRGDSLQFAYYYRPDDLNLPIPGLTIDDASLGIFAGTDGFGAEGSIDFTIQNLGTGNVTAGIDSEGNFEVAGSLNFDSELFDRAEISVWYRNRAFGGRGVLGIDSPDKVRGIRSAEITAGYDEGTFSATGTVTPNIPGIQDASLSMEYSEEEGLTIGGSLQLAESVPGIRGGNIEAQVRKRPESEEYELSARGTAQPDIPGLDATLTIAYDDGAITIEGSAAYERGMLSGSLAIGVTNRVLDDSGNPTDEIGEEMRAYGGGTVTAQLTPWLAGTAGIRLLPNGEIELTGSIGLPDVLEIFPEQSYERNIFSINLDIPIIGVAVAGQRIGIFATIGGGLDLSAGIGPGQLQELGLTITYNPDHEDQTHIEGGAKLVIPAHAGLRLFVRAALGAGIPIVSATLGLEMGGQLGIEGAAEAGVQIDWTPATGLVLDAEIAVYAEPKFRFDITGFAEITADLLITEITLYEKRWELAAIEIGSDYRIGVRLPYHQEGDEFAGVDWSAVEFELPDVDPQEVLSSLVDRIT